MLQDAVDSDDDLVVLSVYQAPAAKANKVKSEPGLGAVSCAIPTPSDLLVERPWQCLEREMELTMGKLPAWEQVPLSLLF